MRSAAQVFYLAVFGLLGGSHASSNLTPSIAKAAPSNVCDVSNGPSCASAQPDRQSPKQIVQYEPGAMVTDACASYHNLEQLNAAVHPYLHAIATGTDFFSHYRLNLFNKKCPFWDDENATCGNIACAVNTLDDEKDIPLSWRADYLGQLEGKTAKHPGRKAQREHKSRPLQGSLGEVVDESCVVEYDDECDDRDYCVPEDEGASSKGDYVSLVANPERYTGYAGVGAQQVWQAIYRENCFSKPPKNSQSNFQSSPFGNQQQWQAANQLRNVMKQQGVQQNIKNAIAHGQATSHLDPVELDDTCLEKRVFHRVISGMHASISTHLCFEYFNKTTGEWQHNVDCFRERLAKFPERISNVYFNYALVMRAVGKIRKHVEHYSYCSQEPEEDKRTRDMVVKLSSAIPSGPEIFDETVMFQDPGSALLKEDFRNRFRNVSRIMDCVGCDKCRLWGKVQTAGYGTALKVLFEFDEQDPSNDPPLRRTELVALLNTMDRLSHSLEAIRQFRKLIAQEEGTDLPPTISDPVTEREVQRAISILGTEEEIKQAERQRKRHRAIAAGLPIPEDALEPEEFEALEKAQGKEKEREQMESQEPQSEAKASKPSKQEEKPKPKAAKVDRYPPAEPVPDFRRDWDSTNMSAWEEVKAEFNLIMRVYVYVLKSWAGLPKKFGRIALFESYRLWNYWVGLTVPGRSWEIRIPAHDEM